MSADQQRLVDKLPALTEQLLSGIPRLELVRAILADYPRPFRGERPSLQDDVGYAGTQLLKLAIEAHGPAKTRERRRSRSWWWEWLLAEDVKMTNGVLLAARGHDVPQRFLERIRNSPKGAIKDKLMIAIRSTSPATWWAPSAR